MEPALPNRSVSRQFTETREKYIASIAFEYNTCLTSVSRPTRRVFFKTVNKGDSNKSLKIVARFIDSEKVQQPMRSMLRKILWWDQALAESTPAIVRNNDNQDATKEDTDQDWTTSTNNEGNEEGEIDNVINNENTDTSLQRRSTRTRIPMR